MGSIQKITTVLIICILTVGKINAQSDYYSAEMAPFCSNKYDEYSPVFYRDKIVFCTNREDDLFFKASNKNNEENFNIYYITPSDTATWEDSRIFDKNLVTRFNDGPATFNHKEQIIYYSRNINLDTKKKDIFDPRNKLGIYSARKKNVTWTDIQGFPYNNKDYNNTTPFYDTLRNRLFFASTMPGGFGGTDLYYSEWTDSSWSEPVNLGPTINTKGNEVYPFMSSSRKLYFSSDGHGGFGNKDIYLTEEKNGEWIEPVHLKPPINSKDDDFGLITDHGFKSGYFSSNRKRSDDIYHFKTTRPQFYNCDSLQENNYCYQFWDESYNEIDSLPIKYVWRFSDGTSVNGLEVKHCFPGAGKYIVKLNIVDNRTGNTFFTQQHYEFEIRDAVQPYIRSRDAFIEKKELKFDGLQSNLPDLQIEKYYWEFGDENLASGPRVNHTYKKDGDYQVTLGVTGINDSTGLPEKHCIWKEVKIMKDYQALAMHEVEEQDEKITAIEPKEDPNDEVKTRFNAYERDPDKEIFRVEVLSSRDKVDMDSSVFDPLRDTYEISEFYINTDSIYSYTVGKEESLLSSYTVYNDVVDRGFEQAQVKSYIIAELPKEVVDQVTEEFGKVDNAQFGFNKTKVAKSSYPILDRIVKIMKENPQIKIEIAAHTDNTGSFEYNMKLSKQRAQSIVNYLVSRGIKEDRLFAVGYGESRPIASNQTEAGRRENRRVEFILVDK